MTNQVSSAYIYWKWGTWTFTYKENYVVTGKTKYHVQRMGQDDITVTGKMDLRQNCREFCSPNIQGYIWELALVTSFVCTEYKS